MRDLRERFADEEDDPAITSLAASVTKLRRVFSADAIPRSICLY
jgi:hypothetical protein